MITFITFLLTLLTFSQSITAFTAKLHNNCGSSLYVFTNAADGKSSDELQVSSGSWYEIPYVPKVNPISSAARGGITMLVSQQPHKASNGASEAAEFSLVQNGATLEVWYNWSKDHGDPVVGMARTIQPAGGCHQLRCEAGSESCDYSTAGIGKCVDTSYVKVTIC